MFSKIKLSLSNINYKLYFALLVLGLAPTVYTTVRVFFLGSLPGEYSFSIAGQLSWVNLLYEIINEAIILPLFYFIGKVAKTCTQNDTGFGTIAYHSLEISCCLINFVQHKYSYLMGYYSIILLSKQS